MKKQNTYEYIVKLSGNQTTLVDRLIKFDKKQSKTTGKQYGNIFSVDVDYLATKLFDKKVEKRYIYNLLTELIEKKNIITRYDKGNNINGINSSYIINYHVLMGDEWCGDNMSDNTTDDTITIPTIDKKIKKSKTETEINTIYNNNLLTFLNITKENMIESEFENYIDDIAKEIIHKVQLTQTITPEEYNILTDTSHYAMYVAYYYATTVANVSVSTYEEFVSILGEDIITFEKRQRLNIFKEYTFAMKWSAVEMYSLANVIENASNNLAVDNSELISNIRFDVARFLPDMINEDVNTMIKVKRLKNYICSTPYCEICQLDVNGKRLDEIINIIGYK